MQPGSRIAHFEVLGLVGVGGMGEVYRARDLRLQRDVAIKLLPAEFASDPDRLRRFEQEARAIAALDHPNILAIHDVDTYAGAPYIVTELLEGKSLRQRLRGGSLPVHRAVDLAVQIVHGLAAAHSRGIVHRDLKPGNIFITKEGHAKILDFGIAKLAPAMSPAELAQATTVSEATEAGTMLGTVGYMAPEQLRGQTVDQRSDIFSFGCVLYEMLAGSPPFKRDSVADTISAILSEDPPPLTVPGREIPTALRAVVSRCLEREREDRFQSAQDLAFELGLLTGAPEISPAPGPHAVERRWLLRGVGLAGFVALLLLAAAIGRHTAKQSVPLFSRLSFRQGLVATARFAPDGETVVYSARWEDRVRRLYLKRPDAPDALLLDLPGAGALAVSRNGEVALVQTPDYAFSSELPGLLARAPLSGGAPREIAESVTFADWAPDGSEVVVVRSQGGQRRLEFPPGRLLYETAGDISSPRFSRSGDLIAFADHPYPNDDRGSIAVINRSGNLRTLTGEWPSIQGVAWSPKGDEIWFAASEPGLIRGLYAVSTTGRVRLLLQAPGELVLDDVSPAGRVIVTRDDRRFGILVGTRNEKERDVTWLGGGVPVDISADGRLLLFLEQTMVSEYAVCLRRTDGSPPVVLGEGQAMALSPDGAWVLASAPSPDAPLVLLPTGPGEAKKIGLRGISHRNAAFSPDGRSILFEGYEAGHKSRFYQVSVEGGTPRPVTAEGASPVGPATFTISPDGAWVAATGEGPSVDTGSTVWLYPIAGGERRRLPCELKAAFPIRWSTDGKALFVVERSDPARIVRVDVATGQLEVIRELVPADPLARPFPWVTITPDGSTYAYAYLRQLSELYLVKDLK